MSGDSSLSALVAEAEIILAAVGIPTLAMTRRRKERMAKAFLAVAGMTPDDPWSSARSTNRLRSRDVIRWMNEHLGEAISSGSYDDIRRKDLKLPVEAGLILKSAGKVSAATNDGTRTYALSTETATLLHYFGTPQWLPQLSEFMQGRISLAAQLNRSRSQHRVSINIGRRQLLFGPGEHNQLQKAVVEEFLPRFGQGAQVLYLGDTEEKFQLIEREMLLGLGLLALAHEELPDVVAYSPQKNWLFIVEAVHSANPISELRKRKLEVLTQSCTAAVVYVTAFLTRDVFRRFSSQIAWETEVWIADAPDHLIHFNGDKFLGPHLLAK